MALRNVRVTGCWPMTSSNRCGRHLRARTWYAIVKWKSEKSGKVEKVSGKVYFFHFSTSPVFHLSSDGSHRDPVHLRHTSGSV